jgi:hypothetical protein
VMASTAALSGGRNIAIRRQCNAAP